MLVYKIVNDLNDKIYIGCTIKKLNKRWNQHIYSCFKKNQQQKIYKSIRALGLEHFSIELIEECKSIKIMREKEIEYIKKFNTIEKGYNVSLVPYGEKYKKKENFKTMKKKIYRKCLITKKIYSYDSLRDTIKENFNPSKISECANLKNNRIIHKNNFWSFINNKKEWKKIEILNEKKIKLNQEKNRKKVMNITNNEIFNSCTEAAKFYNLKNSVSISEACSGRKKTAAKCEWKYIE